MPRDATWRKGEQDTVAALLDARLENDPDSEYYFALPRYIEFWKR